MIATDDDGRLEFALRHKVIQRQAEFVAFAVTQPTNPRWQPLKLYFLLRHLNPTLQMLVFREHFQDQLIGTSDV